ncbi:hypothetical protein [Streptomyces caelestis]|uniref:hypothetical protein n=1 Tax=Streptomyces caelestis TaxID=36816 RepID=UPI0036F6AB93
MRPPARRPRSSTGTRPGEGATSGTEAQVLDQDAPGRRPLVKGQAEGSDQSRVPLGGRILDRHAAGRLTLVGCPGA